MIIFPPFDILTTNYTIKRREKQVKEATVEKRYGYSDLYEQALRVAAGAHVDQRRKGKEIPYITHPVQVSIILLHYDFPMEAVIAGLLHDVVEDQSYELTQIEEDFGPLTAEIVDALSERKRNEQGKKRPWETRKQEALEKIRQSSQEAVAVKVADTLHNTRCFILDFQHEGAELWENFSRGVEAQLDYYNKVLDVARERLGAHLLVDELAEALAELAGICAVDKP
jgi:(p)ppGpp synthase/HD superfamily hydrolase